MENKQKNFRVEKNVTVHIQRKVFFFQFSAVSFSFIIVEAAAVVLEVAAGRTSLTPPPSAAVNKNPSLDDEEELSSLPFFASRSSFRLRKFNSVISF